MKKIITLLSFGVISMFMQACTTYGGPYYNSGSAEYYYQQPVQYSSFSVSSSPRPRIMPRTVQYNRPIYTQRCRPLPVYQPYTYQVHDIQSDTIFNIQDRTQMIKRGGGQAPPTFFYNP